MRSMQIVAFGEALDERIVEDPPRPQGTEVVMRVTACGVCHSDVHLWEGYYDLGEGERIDIAGRFKLPHTLGHEIVGDVEAVGWDPRPGGWRSAGGGWCTRGSAAANARTVWMATRTCARGHASLAPTATAATANT